jgi:hypothetical protein
MVSIELERHEPTVWLIASNFADGERLTLWLKQPTGGSGCSNASNESSGSSPPRKSARESVHGCLFRNQVVIDPRPDHFSPRFTRIERYSLQEIPLQMTEPD